MFEIHCRMSQLIKHEPNAKYVDLILTFADEGDNDVNGPMVRYFF
jgi:hypothetical protein